MSTHVHDWRGIDIGRMCFICGQIEEQYHSGQEIRTLLLAVELAEGIVAHGTDEPLRDPAELLMGACRHLADGMGKDATEGDVTAWFEVQQRLNCLLTGKTRECANCHEMEGLHRLGTYCNDQKLWQRGLDSVVSLRFEAK